MLSRRTKALRVGHTQELSGVSQSGLQIRSGEKRVSTKETMIMTFAKHRPLLSLRPKRYVLLSNPFYRWENEGSGQLRTYSESHT